MKEKIVEHLEELKKHITTFENWQDESIGNLKSWYLDLESFICFFEKKTNEFITPFFSLKEANALLLELKEFEELLFFLPKFQETRNKILLSTLLTTEKMTDNLKNTLSQRIEIAKEKLNAIVEIINKTLEIYTIQELIHFANYFIEIFNCKEASQQMSLYMIENNKRYITFFKSRILPISDKDKVLFLNQLERRNAFIEKENVTDEEKLACMQRGYQFVKYQINSFATIKAELEGKEVPKDNFPSNTKYRKTIIMGFSVVAILLVYNEIFRNKYSFSKDVSLFSEQTNEKIKSYNMQSRNENSYEKQGRKEIQNLNYNQKMLNSYANQADITMYNLIEKNVKEERHYYEIPIYGIDFQDFIYEHSLACGVPYKAVFIAIELESGGSWKSNGIVSKGNYGLAQINRCHLNYFNEKYGYTESQIKNDPQINVICCVDIFKKIMQAYDYDINNYEMSNLLGMYNVGNKDWEKSEQGQYYVEKGLELYNTKYSEDLVWEKGLQRK